MLFHQTFFVIIYSPIFTPGSFIWANCRASVGIAQFNFATQVSPTCPGSNVEALLSSPAQTKHFAFSFVSQLYNFFPHRQPLNRSFVSVAIYLEKLEHIPGEGIDWRSLTRSCHCKRDFNWLRVTQSDRRGKPCKSSWRNKISSARSSRSLSSPICGFFRYITRMFPTPKIPR